MPFTPRIVSDDPPSPEQVLSRDIEALLDAMPSVRRELDMVIPDLESNPQRSTLWAWLVEVGGRVVAMEDERDQAEGS